MRSGKSKKKWSSIKRVVVCLICLLLLALLAFFASFYYAKELNKNLYFKPANQEDFTVLAQNGQVELTEEDESISLFLTLNSNWLPAQSDGKSSFDYKVSDCMTQMELKRGYQINKGTRIKIVLERETETEESTKTPSSTSTVESNAQQEQEITKEDVNSTTAEPASTPVASTEPIATDNPKPTATPTSTNTPTPTQTTEIKTQTDESATEENTVYNMIVVNEMQGMMMVTVEKSFTVPKEILGKQLKYIDYGNKRFNIGDWLEIQAEKTMTVFTD